MRRMCLNVTVSFVHMCIGMTQSRQRELWVKAGGEREPIIGCQWEAAFLGTRTRKVFITQNSRIFSWRAVEMAQQVKVLATQARQLKFCSLEAT